MSTGIGVGISSVFTSRPAGGPSIILEYSTSDYCETQVPGVVAPTVIQPAPPAGIFTSSGSGLVVNAASGVFNIGVSQPGNYIITYTVGTQSATFPINIGPVIDATITGDSATCVGNAPVPADLTAVAGYSNYEWFKDNVSVQNGSSNTYTPAFDVAGTFTYKVIITDSSLSSVDCTATSLDFTFTVNALPTIAIADATGGFCSGSSTTITTTVSAGTVFAWYKDDVLIVGQTGSSLTVSEAGEYTATVTDGNGCTSLPSNGLDIEEFISPTVLITTAPGTTICTGDTATLTAEANGGAEPYTYLWSNSATTQAISVSPTTTTTYTVTVTDDNGCTGTASQEITASTAGTAIASINNDAAMSFNGIDQYIQAVDSSNLRINGDMTISAWVKLDSSQTGNYQKIINKRAAGGVNYDFYLNNDTIPKIKFFDGNNSSDQSTGTITPGSWTHVAITIKSGVTNGSTFFIDGAASGTGTYTITSEDGPLYIGRYYDSPTYGGWWPGEMDEVAIFNKALSLSEVGLIYDATNDNPGKAGDLFTGGLGSSLVYWNRMGDS